MDPITTAIIAGAAVALKDTAETAVKDSYQALKQALTRWFADKPEAQTVLQQIEQHPEDAKAQHSLEVIITTQQQTTPPQDDLRPLIAALVQALQQHSQSQDPQRIGVLIEALKTKDLKFGHVQPPQQTGIGVKMGTVKAESVTFDKVGSLGEP
ncbi:MAG: hypothetical protein WAW39_25840 [Prosthecobacter sp.]|uniref:hypothetical protein n=1 Tax=Prosthecobacter sp. TaxID=1965333 RepID=UPI003BB210BC